MGRGKGVIFAATAVLLALAVLCGLITARQESPYLTVEISAQGGTEQIRFWENAQGDFLLFLPGGVSLSAAKFRTNASGSYLLNDHPVSDGETLADLSLETDYVLSHPETNLHTTLRIHQTQGVPTMYIDVTSGSMEYIHAQRGNSEPGIYRLYTAQGNLENAGSLDSVKGRGNASWWSHEKKPYSLTLGTEADLLQMGKAKNWILLSNGTDPSHLKNKSVLDFASHAGLAFSAESQWVNLYLNGTYTGLYLLCERNEIHTQRVNLSSQDSFLVSMELESRLVKREYPYILTDAKQALRIHQSTMDQEQLLALWQSAENAILAEDGFDPVTGKHWTELIDLESWVRKYLLEETFGNGDACSISQFFYYDGTKIYAGPPWDYDTAMGSFVPETLYGIRFQACEGKPTPWFCSLYQKEEFYNRVMTVYETEYRPLLLQLIQEGLESYAGGISSSMAVDLLRWPGTDPDVAREAIQSYMTRRIAFLDSLWLEKQTYCFVHVDLGEGYNGAIFAVRPGDCLPPLPSFADTETETYHGWYDMESHQVFDPSQPVHEDARIYLKKTTSAASEPIAQVQPEETEPLTLMRLGPMLVFGAMLFGVAAADCILEKRKKPHLEGKNQPCR